MKVITQTWISRKVWAFKPINVNGVAEKISPIAVPENIHTPPMKGLEIPWG